MSRADCPPAVERRRAVRSVIWFELLTSFYSPSSSFLSYVTEGFLGGRGGLFATFLTRDVPMCVRGWLKPERKGDQIDRILPHSRSDFLICFFFSKKKMGSEIYISSGGLDRVIFESHSE